MRVRVERADDRAAVRAIVIAAFARSPASEAVEAALLDRLRASSAWLPLLSLVAESDGAIVGHVVCSRGLVDHHPVLALGPLAVRPDVQRGGIGTALMREVLATAEALREPAVVLLGDGRYYARFGFRPARELGIESPEPAWGDDLQARRLDPTGVVPRGVFHFAPPFDGL